VQLALEGTKVGMPLIVDVQAIGPRVVLDSKAIELGVSYSLEAGGDGVAVRWPGEDSFKTIIAMAADVPVWVKPAQLPVLESELDLVLDLGGSGLWLDHQLYAEENFSDILGSIIKRLHTSVAED